jgi:hypothetical protein
MLLREAWAFLFQQSLFLDGLLKLAYPTFRYLFSFVYSLQEVCYAKAIHHCFVSFFRDPD